MLATKPFPQGSNVVQPTTKTYRWKTQLCHVFKGFGWRGATWNRVWWAFSLSARPPCAGRTRRSAVGGGWGVWRTNMYTPHPPSYSTNSSLCCYLHYLYYFFLHFFFVTYLYRHIYRYIDIYTHLFHLFETINLKKFRKIKSFMMTSPLLLHLKGCPRWKLTPFFHPQLGCVSLSSLQRYIMPSPDSLGVRISS